MNHLQLDVFAKVTAQVEYYSAKSAADWHAALASWPQDIRDWVGDTLKRLSGTPLMYGRIGKIARYDVGPVRGKRVLVFGEVRPGKVRFVPGTDQLIIGLNGREVHLYWNDNHRSATLRFKGGR